MLDVKVPQAKNKPLHLKRRYEQLILQQKNEKYKQGYVDTVPPSFHAKHVFETHFTTVFTSVLASRG